MSDRFPNRAGFTLLEMLVALGLVSVIAGSLFVSMFSAFRARETAEAAMAPVRTGELAASLIRGAIEGVLPPTGVLAAEFVGEDLVGDDGRPADSLVLHCAAGASRDEEAACDIRRIELTRESMDDDEDGTDSVVRRVTGRLLAPETIDPPAEVLCRNVLGFNLRYYDGDVWQDVWDSTTQGNELPLAVEVTLEIGHIDDGGSAVIDHDVVRIVRVMTEGPASTQEGMSVEGLGEDE